MTGSRLRRLGRRRLVSLLVGLSVLLPFAGCSEGVLTPKSEEPFLYLVLNQVAPLVDPPRQTAFLLTTGTPLASEYRHASVFEMRRVSDGALFDWRDLGLSGEAPVGVTSADLALANFELSDTSSPQGLGRQDVQPGEAYTLLVRTEGETIRGRTTVPASFTFGWSSDRRAIAWPRVEGAAAYSVALSHGGTVVQTDTAYRIPSEVTGGRISVRALDPNAHAYLVDGRAERAGIRGAYGVFGAVTVADAPPEGDRISGSVRE